MTLLSDDFWRHILGSTHDGVGLLTSVGQLLGDSEVCQLEVTIGVQEDVLWLQVSVDDVHLVEILQSEKNLSSIEFGTGSDWSTLLH